MNYLKKNSNNLMIILFSIYIVLGNLPRFIHIPNLDNNLLLTEVILELTTIFVMLYKIKYYLEFFKKDKVIIKILLVFLTFSFLGFIYHKGASIQSFVYSIRVILLFLTSLLIGKAFKEKFGLNVTKLLNTFIAIYFSYTVIGWGIFILNPHSDKLWSNLAEIGIVFNGDPHIGRFLGTFFDPNFTSSILILPTILCLYLYFNEKKYTYVYLAGFIYFCGCIFFTYSRSGLLGISISCFVVAFFYIRRTLKKHDKIDKKVYRLMALFIIGVFILILFERDQVFRLISRFNNVLADPSAQHRFKDYYKGINHIVSSVYVFLFGIGYNYIKLELDTNLNSLDSSLINTIICFGVLGTGLLTVFIVNYMKRLFNKLNIIAKRLSSYILGYILAVLVICNFNDLLYYQFFIITFVSLLSYFYLQNTNEAGEQK